jgi:hypothetical protein
LGHRLGVGAFGVDARVAARAGDQAVERHEASDTGHEELYLVLRGAARFTVDGEEVAAPAGTAVFVRDPTVTRSAGATGDGTLTLAIGARRGAAFEPSACEARWLARLGVIPAPAE